MTTIVVEAAGAGTDLVISTANYQLTAEVEDSTLAGIAAISGWGNPLSATSSRATRQRTCSMAGAGNDRLLGGDGVDTLIGGDGTDILNGEGRQSTACWAALAATCSTAVPGADRMEGGTENDTYTVDTWTDDGIRHPTMTSSSRRSRRHRRPGKFLRQLPPDRRGRAADPHRHR